MDRLLPRHDGHMAMGSTSSMAMSGMATATSSMMHSMASSTDMVMSHDMDHDMAGMHMFFTTAYANYPVLFDSLKANTDAKAFGIFVLLFFIGVCVRGLDFLKDYLEQRVWQNPNYLETPIAESVHYKTRSSVKDVSSEELESTQETHPVGYSKSVPAMLIRNFIRLILCFVPEMFGFALMLAAMTYTVVYFFAVVTGLAVGRFTFERLSDRMRLRPNAGGFHC